MREIGQEYGHRIFICQNWEQAYNDTLKLFTRIKEDNFIPDLIIGIARGGWIPARLMADFFTLKETANIKVEAYEMMGDLHVEARITQDINTPISDRKILIIDDIADSGKSLKAVIDSLEKRNPKEMKTATLYFKERSIVKPDYYNLQTNAWVIFPWEVYETIKELDSKFHKEGMSKFDIKLRLQDIGLPVGSVESYYYTQSL